MSTSHSENKTHNSTVNAAEAVRQSAVAGATQTAVMSAEVTFYRAALASAITNGVSPSNIIVALKSLGTGGA